jgi:hypothetical protein
MITVRMSLLLMFLDYPLDMLSFARHIHIFLLVLCTWPIAHAQQQQTAAPDKNIQQYLTSLKSGKTCERRAAIKALHHLGKDAIPTLIDHIGEVDIAESSALMLANPLLSYAPPGSQRDEYSGVVYAYVIELILAKDALQSDSSNCDFLLDHSDYAYGHGLILKGKKVISATELAHVKQLYVQWWETHRNESLISLRHEWMKSVRPLTGSGYHWL